ncbi:Flavoprotein wrbA [Thioalkalivibrio nitratireducens DSM 14787]|uniref:Flavoprotein wrbA n=1 Tax=Thioalkalivibrio nitratireducens (strain DSM 14787 / UNIQEM 213 / ALEN2) TaxID=1255043 RepID=L0E1E8_THIND|nr:NAD(P)H:quinone oxidoreductase [Thioalkalivibrio nitratireducens]AGA35030.1 Flavoprotein wrbA [Thioalkalivibrio nitratireducens DSM 14787]
MAEILVLYYSRYGATASLARAVATGVERSGAAARVRTVPPVASGIGEAAPAVPKRGPPYASPRDLEETDGLVLGSPTRFGNMAAPLKHFLDGTSGLWTTGALVDRPFGVFTSTSTMHGGQETTLLSMALPLIHQGMVWVGVPYTVPELGSTTGGGGPYGASHVAGPEGGRALTRDERRIAEALGQRVGRLAARLAGEKRP